ncbi:hypothetical protein BKA66DRAFT_152217 [Pyrenochaeta sp. MPI-SDFR-AT-0127]|nr:hypothetical protein BKA66DRAFT_152217 [Pyrenochaeta sp. MPI-SDFR-AT-0127]
MPSTNSSPKIALRSQLEELVHRAVKAKVQVEESGQDSHEETWEVIDKEEVNNLTQDEHDMEEWVVVVKAKSNPRRR